MSAVHDHIIRYATHMLSSALTKCTHQTLVSAAPTYSNDHRCEIFIRARIRPDESTATQYDRNDKQYAYSDEW